MSRLILPITSFCLIAWVGGGVLTAGLQIAKANADRLADTMCEVTQDCR